MKVRAFHACGFTLLELVVVLAVFALFSVLFARAQADTKAKGHRIACVNNLREIGQAFRTWSNQRGGGFPMEYGVDKGGSREGIDREQPWLHFAALSNHLTTPKVLVCPADDRQPAASLSNLTVSNLSYCVGIDADGSIPFMLLSGDRNVTNGTLLAKGILDLADTRPAGWTETIHNQVGDVGLSDGSVNQVSSSALRRLITASNNRIGFGSTRVQFPNATGAPAR
jgi:prepilin-type N-terminal cleavage/methylation domain-containing protein